ncbi:MAG: lipid kinase YegS [Pseudomonadota bacterium]
MDLRIILNGKKAGLEPVRSAIFKARESGVVEVRATWEAGDVQRLVQEACQDGCQRLVAGGGDGTVNEVTDALLKLPIADRPELAVLPLGTANDFATGCTIPSDSLLALRLAQSGQACPVDTVKANDFHFINVASGGFGAQVTANTPVALKNFLGGGAYTLSGLVQALNFTPYHGEVRLPQESLRDTVIVGAVCNGRQAGGGQQLAPAAMIDDGLLDVVSLNYFPSENVAQVVAELLSPKVNGEYVRRFRVPWVEWESGVEMPINLDGEPISARNIRFEVLPGAIKLVLPENCPMTASCS